MILYAQVIIHFPILIFWAWIVVWKLNRYNVPGTMYLLFFVNIKSSYLKIVQLKLLKNTYLSSNEYTYVLSLCQNYNITWPFVHVHFYWTFVHSFSSRCSSSYALFARREKRMKQFKSTKMSNKAVSNACGLLLRLPNSLELKRIRTIKRSL